MSSFVERRILERFHVPNAKVKYKLEALFSDQLPVEGKGDLIDLTVKGVRFETDEDIKAGSRLNIEIILNNDERIPLIGNVVWTKALENGKINSVVEFIDFDDDPEFNSFDSLEKLEELEKEYSRY
ncbi:MAG TPA: hypothetical protein ENO27_04260 [Caldithrix sp.]|nr:PilZ domain-containing protein [Calditrichaceae bacterium]HEM49408.1 hypothetical protein [Caldithrix sp.]